MLFAADLNDKQWTASRLMCQKSVSYLVNGASSEVLVSGSFENGDSIYFVMPPKSSHALDFEIKSNYWFSPKAKHHTATVTATNAVNGEHLFSGTVNSCDNLIITGPVRMHAYQMNWA